MATENAEHLIEIRVDRLAQLFHTLDPFPFREKDLDQDAEEYIVSWARELPDKRPLRIAVHIPDGDVLDAHSKELNEAFHSLFRRPRRCRPSRTQRAVPGRPPLARDRYPDPRCMLHPGASCRWISSANPVQRLVEESLLILGWVANWRPLEIFLYDWWPLARRRRLVPASGGGCSGAQAVCGARAPRHRARSQGAVGLFRPRLDSLRSNSEFA